MNPETLNILHLHKWRSVQEWAETLDELADVSDNEIDDLLRAADDGVRAT